MIFKRKIYKKMLDWKKRFDGTSALLIEGARRVGKSTVAEEFARNEYDAYLLIDFSTAGQEVFELFNNFTTVDRFFLGLSAITDKDLPERKSLIIFDEIQFCPKARQSIKYLVKDGRYDYLETGSLISIKKNVKDILIPSEEKRINMYPMDFEEFLSAGNKKGMINLIRDSFENKTPLGDAMNRNILNEFRLYMLVGGMPQAVNAYLEKKDFRTIDEIKRNIIDLYTSDFRKFDNLGRVSSIFNHIPSELERNTLRYKIGSVIPGIKPSRLGEMYADLADSKTVNFAYHTSDPNINMAAYANYDMFKLFMGDTGLFITLAFKDFEYTDNELYRKILLGKTSANLGYIFENAVAQQLVASGHSLFYNTFRQKSLTNGNTMRNYEIDFLIRKGNKIIPIEVKSGNSKAHRSLDLFCTKYSSRISESVVLHTKDLSKDGNILYMPVYMASLL